MAANRKIVQALKTDLQNHADPVAAVKMQSYMKSAMPFYGIKTPVLRGICKANIQEFPLNSFEVWRDTVLQLWRRAKYREERYCAIQLCEAKAYQPFQSLDTIPYI